jgi:hypothetical protein
MTTLSNLKIPTDFSPVYFCPKCSRIYGSEGAARTCDGSDRPAEFEVGQIVRIDVGYGWYDGDPKWLILNTGDHHGRKTHDAFFVVTAVDYDRSDRWHAHDPRYWVKTLGIKNGNPTGMGGYTYPATHVKLHPVEQDPILVAEGAKYIGEKSGGLI